MPPRNQTPAELKDLSLFDLIKCSIRSQQCMESVKSMTTRAMKFNIKCEGSWFTLRLFQGEQPENSRMLSEDVEIHAISMYRRRADGELRKINGQHVLTSFEQENQIHTYWDSPIQGMCFLLDHFSDLFNSPPIYQFKIDKSTAADRKKIANWIKNKRASKVEHCFVDPFVKIATKELKAILGQVKPTVALKLHLNMNPNFRYKLPSDLKYFSCFSSNWLTKGDVMKMNYEFIRISVEKFTYQDLSDFATKCIEGGLPALQHCLIEAKDLKKNFKLIADGINYDRTWSRLDVKKDRTKYTRLFFDVCGIYDYERADGKTVTICGSDGNRSDKYCVLHLYVWTK